MIKKKEKQKPVEYPIVTWEETAMGKYKVIEQRNGVKVKILREPSKAWTAKMDKVKAAEKKRQEEMSKKKNEEKLIQDKMREMAITALKKDGKL